MKTIDEMIAVMERARKGAQIQARVRNGGDWFSIPYPAWDWDTQDYRVEPVTKTMDIFLATHYSVTDAILNGECRDEETAFHTKKVTITWDE